MLAEAFGGALVPLVLPGLPEREPGAALDARALGPWTLLGAARDASGRERLPGAREELAALAGFHGERARALVGATCDRAALLAAFSRGGPLHVATHLARASDDGGRYEALGLELAGGDVATAAEIAAARPRLPLVALVACETAAGRFVDAEGLLGVARAFLESGTRDLLVTLWPVEDRAAREYALLWHAALREGLAPSRAAARARAELAAKGVSPAEWAAFRLCGRD